MQLWNLRDGMLTVTGGGEGVKLPPHWPQGDLSTLVPVPVVRFINAFVTTFPKYVFFTK